MFVVALLARFEFCISAAHSAHLARCTLLDCDTTLGGLTDTNRIPAGEERRRLYRIRPIEDSRLHKTD